MPRAKVGRRSKFPAEFTRRGSRLRYSCPPRRHRPRRQHGQRTAVKPAIVGVAYDNDGEVPSRKVLLVPKVLVRSDKHFEARRLRRVEQIAGNQPIPSALSRLGDAVALEVAAQRSRGALVKQDAHLLSKSWRIGQTGAGRGYGPRTQAPLLSVPGSNGTSP